MSSVAENSRSNLGIQSLEVMTNMNVDLDLFVVRDVDQKVEGIKSKQIGNASFSGSERESVELPNWRALGMAAPSVTDAGASARSVARSNC